MKHKSSQRGIKLGGSGRGELWSSQRGIKPGGSGRGELWHWVESVFDVLILLACAQDWRSSVCGEGESFGKQMGSSAHISAKKPWECAKRSPGMRHGRDTFPGEQFRP